VLFDSSKKIKPSVRAPSSGTTTETRRERSRMSSKLISDSDLTFECLGVISISDPDLHLGLVCLSESVYLSVLLYSHLNLYPGLLRLAPLITCFFPFQNVLNHKSLRSSILVVISGFLFLWTLCYREHYHFSHPTSYLWLLFPRSLCVLKSILMFGSSESKSDRFQVFSIWESLSSFPLASSLSGFIVSVEVSHVHLWLLPQGVLKSLIHHFL